MSVLNDLVSDARVPRIVKGRISAGEREAIVERFHVQASEIRAGSSKRAALVELLGALLGAGADIGAAELQRRAAEAALKAAEAELAAAQDEGEG